jgi:hypothetical protein
VGRGDIFAAEAGQIAAAQVISQGQVAAVIDGEVIFPAVAQYLWIKVEEGFQRYIQIDEATNGEEDLFLAPIRIF